MSLATRTGVNLLGPSPATSLERTYPTRLTPPRDIDGLRALPAHAADVPVIGA